MKFIRTLSRKLRGIPSRKAAELLVLEALHAPEINPQMRQFLDVRKNGMMKGHSSLVARTAGMHNYETPYMSYFGFETAQSLSTIAGHIALVTDHVALAFNTVRVEFIETWDKAIVPTVILGLANKLDTAIDVMDFQLTTLNIDDPERAIAHVEQLNNMLRRN